MKTTLGLAALLLSSASVQANTVETSTDSTQEMERKMLKTVSNDMKKIMERLEGDWEFIGKFLDSPQEMVKGYNLTDKEVLALTTRSINDLMSLGLSEEEVTVAMSGTHRGGGRVRM